MYYFFLGNTPDLSFLELKSIFAGEFMPLQTGINTYAGEFSLAQCERLGGTRKVASSLAIVAPADLETKLIELVLADGAKNVAVTRYVPESLVTLSLKNLKTEVMKTRSIRLVSMDLNEHELLMLAHQHVSEFNLLPSGEEIMIAKTVWIYDAEDWVARDRAKPYRDIKRGMLPPKVARIMVNLATQGKSGLTLADPFCGTGTVLSEAMLLGYHVVGGDINPDAVSGAESNLAWLLSGRPVTPLPSYSITLTDASHFSHPVDCIATEPYMGPLLDERNPLPLEKIQNIARGLDKLYRGAFKSWLEVLPAGGRVVMSIPSFVVYNRIVSTISIDTLQALGYNYLSSVTYSKPGAAVIRNITILEKK